MRPDRHPTLLAHQIIDILPDWPFYILVSSIFHRKVCVSKHTIVSDTALPPNYIQTIVSTNQNFLAIGTAKIDKNPFNEIHFNVLFDTENFSAVHYKPIEH